MCAVFAQPRKIKQMAAHPGCNAVPTRGAVQTPTMRRKKPMQSISINGVEIPVQTPEEVSLACDMMRHFHIANIAVAEYPDEGDFIDRALMTRTIGRLSDEGKFTPSTPLVKPRGKKGGRRITRGATLSLRIRPELKEAMAQLAEVRATTVTAVWEDAAGMILATKVETQPRPFRLSHHEILCAACDLADEPFATYRCTFVTCPNFLEPEPF